MIDAWLQEKVDTIRVDDPLTLKLALIWASDLVVMNMGGTIDEAVNHFLEVAGRCVEEK